MTRSRQHQYITPTHEDLAFITRVAGYASDRLFKPDDPELSKYRNELDRKATYSYFKTELRSLLTSPAASTKLLGAIL